MALFDAVGAALLRAWDEAKGRPPDARFGAALRAAVQALEGIGLALAEGRGPAPAGVDHRTRRKGKERRPTDPARVEEMARLRDAGLTLAETGPRFDITRQRAHYALARKRRVAAETAYASCGAEIPLPARAGVHGARCLPRLARRPGATSAERLKACRADAGLNLANLSRRSGVSASMLSKHAVGRTRPHRRCVLQIGRALGARLAPMLLGLPGGS
jgi:hypothetical protein